MVHYLIHFATVILKCLLLQTSFTWENYGKMGQSIKPITEFNTRTYMIAASKYVTVQLSVRFTLITIRRLLEVDVCISETATSDHISANTNAQHRASCRELLKQHSLGHLGMQIPDVQRRHWIWRLTLVHLLSLLKVNKWHKSKM